MNTTYTMNGNVVTIVETYTAGTKVCTMTAPLVPSGSYFMIDGTYSCVMNSEVGTWRGTMLCDRRWSRATKCSLRRTRAGASTSRR